MLNCLRDLMRHTAGLGIEVIKVTGDNDKVSVEGMDTGKTVVLKGEFTKELPELNGVFGLSQLEVLSKLVNVYKEAGDDLKIVRKEKEFSVQKTEDGELVFDSDGNPEYEKVREEIIDEFIFSRKSPKMVNPYRVLDRRMIPDQAKFGGADWDIVIKPTKQAIDLLATQASFGVEEYFGVKTEGDVLYLTFGDQSSQAVIEFATDVKGTMTKPWLWNVSSTLSILKFSENAECTMSFLDKGALQITLKTGLAEYNYIMPAKAR